MGDPLECSALLWILAPFIRLLLALVGSFHNDTNEGRELEAAPLSFISLSLFLTS